MTDEDGRQDWHDQRGVTWAAGAAVVALIALLVWAVTRTATDSSVIPGSAPSVTSASASPTRTTTGSSDYPIPSVQTSEGSALPPPPPAVEAPPPDEPTVNTPTSTSIFNPYVTTTQPPGGAV